MLSPAEEAMLDHVFKYHPPSPEQQVSYGKLREAAKQFARAILENCPEGADRKAALNKVRVAVMLANASVALGGVGGAGI